MFPHRTANTKTHTHRQNIKFMLAIDNLSLKIGRKMFFSLLFGVLLQLFDDVEIFHFWTLHTSPLPLNTFRCFRDFDCSIRCRGNEQTLVKIMTDNEIISLDLQELEQLGSLHQEE